MFLLTIIIGVIYFYIYRRQQSISQMDLTEDKVLNQNVLCISREKIKVELNKIEKAPSNARVKITNFNNEKDFEFRIENVKVGHYNAYEIHECALYIVKEFNVDYKIGKALPGYRIEVWQYQYNGNGKKFVESDDFRVNPLEIFIATKKGYFGSPDYAIIIKDIKTLNDVFALPMAEIEKKSPDIIGNMSFAGGGWSRDGRYLWADMAYGANTLGFIRIDSQGWSVDLFTSPKDVLGGDALNLEKGLITVHPDNVWFGFADITKEEKEKRREQGIGTELYIHNLITSERQFVAKTDEPLWYFKPKWFSDAELQYELPNGEKKIYVVK